MYGCLDSTEKRDNQSMFNGSQKKRTVKSRTGYVPFTHKKCSRGYFISVETVFQKENMMKYVLMKYLFIAEHHR